MSTPTAPEGRVLIATRAQRRVFAALTAEELEIPAPAARVSIADDTGRVAARVDAPAGLSSAGRSIADRVAATRRRIAEDGARLTGAEIARVTVRITDVRLPRGARS